MRVIIQKIVGPIIGLSLIVGIYLCWHWLSGAAEESRDGQSQEMAAQTVRHDVVLPPEKLAAAKIEVASVSIQTVQAQVVVPGRITYDENHHIEVRSAASGIIVSMQHKPGDVVASGQLLAVVSSPEVGSARADRARRAAELKLAETQHTWEESSFKGIQLITSAIQARQQSSQIRDSLGNTPVGIAGETLLSAYSNLLLTEATHSRMSGVATSGAVSGRLVQERTAQYDSAVATLQANIQQTLFDAQQKLQTAAATLDDARRRYQLACQQVSTLLGAMSLEPEDDVALTKSSDLALVKIYAPIAGSIEKRLLNETERVTAGDGLYVLADTSHLWVSADVREAYWSKVQVAAGDELAVELPAFNDEKFLAKIYYIGREVDPLTNSIPLVASIDNSKSRLRPGLYAKISLPVSQPKSKLMIPESAVAEHDHSVFVFRPAAADRFDRVDVILGGTHQGLVEVQSGLNAGDKIVVQGTFALKSELLLESEE